MPSKEQWWVEIPLQRRAMLWERRYLDDIRNILPTSIADAVGLLNMRWRPDGLIGDLPSRWNPLEYHTYGYWKTHPGSGAGEIRLEDYLERGLDFYVYLCMDSVYVNYDRIKAGDRFTLFLPGGCVGDSLYLQCKIVEPTDPVRRKHQVVYPWDLAFPNLALPVFLHLEPEQLQQIQNIFNNYRANTLTFDLVYSYPLEQRTRLSGDLSQVMVDILVDEHLLPGGMLRWNGFFTFGRKRDKIRFLVASDIHVADRCERIAQVGPTWAPESEGGPGPIGPEFCNYNAQAQRLADLALEKWRSGEIDYVVLVGDLVDYVLKDDVPARVDFKPTAGFSYKPCPYGYGEDAYNLERATSWDNSRPAFDNIPEIETAIVKLAEFKNTNWEVFQKTFGPMMNCVTTFLVPGNHDYIPFGSELAGMNPEEFDRFVNEVARLAAEDTSTVEHVLGVLQIWPVALAWLATGRGSIIDLLIWWYGNSPGYADMATCYDMNLTKKQAEEYDRTRALKCGDDDAFRALAGAFWSASGLTNMLRIGGIACTGPISWFPIQLNKGNWLRLAFLNTGPNWNQVTNLSPWCQGFPDKEKEVHLAILQLENWRNDAAFQDDMLVLFMHAPPLHRRFPSTETEIEGHCFRFVRQPIENIPESDQWPHANEELTNIWRKPIAAQMTNLAKDPCYGAPFHNHMRLLQALCPEEWQITAGESGYVEVPTEVVRKGPVLTFAGHTHWRHVYAVKHFTPEQGETGLDALGRVYFDQGNELLEQLHKCGEPDVWWKKRSLIVTTGCVGPRPAGEYKLTPGGGLARMDYGDESLGFTPPEERQGFFIVTVDSNLGVVSNIEWNRMFYRDCG